MKLRASASFTRRGNARERVAAAFYGSCLRRPNHAHHATITLTEGITIRELAEKLDIRAKELLKILLDRGIFASINQALDVETATDLAQNV